MSDYLRYAKIAGVVLLVLGLVVGISALASAWKTEGIRSDLATAEIQTIILKDSLERATRANAILITENAKKDSTIAADSTSWRVERETLVRSATRERQRAGNIAVIVRERLDSATAIQFDSMRAAERTAFEEVSEALDSTIVELAKERDARSGAEALIAGIRSELALAHMTIASQEVTIETQIELIFRLENPSWSTKVVDALPEVGTGIGLTVLIGAFVVTR